MIWIYTNKHSPDDDIIRHVFRNMRINIMKNSQITIAALALCVLSFGASAATPVPPSGNQDHTQVGIAKATDVEAGSNIAPGSRTTGQSMSDAFNVHTLVAGEWS
ncbi:hypothetical protein KLAF111653_01890 [Klebsiella africana]|uniref:Uncharacterized protein n=2 Tax=Klebsiella africana TaxID=2489010 RepID=A0A8B6INJ7_9ENTR|nr:hypothetical protein SB5857_00525 [Klebsiella africana]